MNSQRTSLQSYVLTEVIIPAKKKFPEMWGVQLLEKFFAGTLLPSPPIRLNAWTVIRDVPRFVESELAIVIANNGNPTFKSSYDRLAQLMEIIIGSQQENDNNVDKGDEPTKFSQQ